MLSGSQALHRQSRFHLASRFQIVSNYFVFTGFEHEPALGAVVFDRETETGPLDFLLTAACDFEGETATVSGQVRIEKRDGAFKRTHDAEVRLPFGFGR